MKKLKKYGVSDAVLNQIPVKDSNDSNFDKYSKNSQSTTWLWCEGNEMKILQQFNVNAYKYCGFLTEPYLLFLEFSHRLANDSQKIKDDLNSNVISNFNMNDSFVLDLINQKVFDEYLITKINFIVFSAISVESFLNNITPNETVIDGNNKQQIELKYSIKQKITKVIPSFKRINDLESYQLIYSEVLRLFDLRNNFVHLKTNSSGIIDSFTKDFETILKMDAKKEFLNVKKLIDFINDSEFIKHL